MRKAQRWLGLTAALLLLLSAAISGTSTMFYYSGYVNSFLGLGAKAVDADADTMYFPSAYGELNAENCEKLILDERDHNIRAMYEGAVLVRNENDALPLKETERRVTLFGNSVKDPVYRTNAGNANFNPNKGGLLYDAFASAGLVVNPTMQEAYQNSGVSRISVASSGQSSIGEVPVSFYTDAMKASFAGDYNDAAIVLFTRYGGEGVDLDTCDADGVPLLSFHQAEADLLKMIHDSGKFNKIIVLINSPFAMDLQWIEEEQYGVDACLVYGATGNYGYIGIADLLTGKSDVSGHFADTWASNSLSSPAMQNYGDFQFTNLNKLYHDRYLVYAEDIYVGYKYYETRYQDQVLGLNNATDAAGAFADPAGWDYAKEMAYPFGYGKSYASFTQTVQSITWDRNAHTVTAEVLVTNDGGFAGKSKGLVQLYVQSPYEPGMAEKSAVSLIGFQKTKELAEGESELVSLTVPDYAFATYDETAPNGADNSKTGCYVFDAGEYRFAIGDDAHDALNNILAAKGASGLFDEQGNPVSGDAAKTVSVTIAERDNTTYATNPVTGEIVSNQLQDVNLNTFIEDGVTYLTRADWTTFPKAVENLTATEQMQKLMEGYSYEKPADAPDAKEVPFNQPADLKLLDMKDVPWDDPQWDTFIQQLTIGQLAEIVGDNRGSAAMPEIGKPQNGVTNGPSGISGAYSAGNGEPCTLYVDAVVQASTWNLDLARERAAFMSEDAIYANIPWNFGPGANIHRTAYLGRNSEYFSEDGWMSYLISREMAAVMTEKGLIAGFKHFVLNDQEVNRHGVATFATEQACREIYYKAFEGALTDGGSIGVMTSYNRIGMTAAAAHEATQVQILRNEWGFKGVNITDSAKDASSYMHTAECLEGGSDLFLSDTGRRGELSGFITKERNGDILKMMQQACKHFFYAHVNSLMINGLAPETVIEETVYWWQPTAIAGCAIIGVLALAAFTVFLWKTYAKKEGK